MANVLVTGGAGYIGSFTRRALREAGHRPVTLDNLTTGHREFVEEELFVGDVRDQAALQSLLTERNIEAVIHFAASALARESAEHPARYYDNNLAGMLSLLNACRAAGVGHVVFSSSCATYGNPHYIPLDESHPQEPVSPYGRSKLICEWILRDFERAYGIRYAALRYFNAAGGDPRGRIGEWHDPETHIIPLCLIAAARGLPVSIFGADHATPDGTCVRDYIHVEDLARAHVLALDYLLRGGGSLELNLGTGQGHSIRDVLAAVERVLGRPVPTRFAEAHGGDPPRMIADARKAGEILGFSCRWTDLDQTVASAWAFIKNIV